MKEESDKDAAFRKKALTGAALAGVTVMLLLSMLLNGGDAPELSLPPGARVDADASSAGVVSRSRVHGGGVESTIPPKTGRDHEIPGLGMMLAYVSPGSFSMGSVASDDDEVKDRQPNEEPMTKVEITRGFWLGRYEVTQAEYEHVMKVNPSRHKDEATEGRLPVDQVSWNDAAEFCRRLTDRERAAGRLPAGFEYALPTEAQWEFACRAGSRTEFSVGDSLSVDQANVVESHPTAGANEYFLRQPAPVGSYEANAWGLHDMHGNVWEWTHDWFAAYPGGQTVDPSGPFDGTARTYRGGCWKYHAKFARSARRGYLDSITRHSDLGFRVALRPTIPTGAKLKKPRF